MTVPRAATEGPAPEPGRTASGRASPYLWLGAAAGATLVLVVVALVLPTGLAGLSWFLGALASIPMLAWFLALRRLTRLGEGWSRTTWGAAALLAYLAVGLVYSLGRLAVFGAVGAWTVPLFWPSLAVVDLAYALDLTTGTLGN